MKPLYEIATLKTHDKLTIHGLYAKSERSKGCFIFINGLTDDVFGSLGTDLAEAFLEAGYSMLLMQTRGAGIITSFDREDKRKVSGVKYENIGTALETFTDAQYDIQAAVDFVKSQKEKAIYLVGASTGCNKSIYYLSQRGKQRGVKGVILLGPLSDYAVFKHDYGDELELLVRYAKKMVEQDKGDDLFPKELFSDLPVSAKRLLSLTTPKSEEEIFTYASEKKPTALQKVTIPTLVVIGGEDEYNERPTLELVEWFENTLAAKKKRVEWIDGASHSLHPKRKELTKLILQWVDSL